jgi:hypothetical protein
MREAGRLLAIGILAGTALSLLPDARPARLPFGLKPDDPLTTEYEDVR